MDSEQSRFPVEVIFPREMLPPYAEILCIWAMKMGGEYQSSGAPSTTITSQIKQVWSEWFLFSSEADASGFVNYTHDFLVRWSDTCRGDNFAVRRWDGKMDLGQIGAKAGESASVD